MCEGEREHVSKIKCFLEYFVDTWHITLHDVEEYFSMCTWNKNKMDEKNNLMKG